MKFIVIGITDNPDATGTGECHLHQHHQGKLPDADCRVSKVEQKKRLKEKMNNEIQFILYHLPDEEGKVQVVIKDETTWATQKAMAQLFGVGIPAISKHLTHIFDEGELDKYTTVSKMEIVVNRGFRGEVKVKQVTGSCFTQPMRSDVEHIRKSGHFNQVVEMV